MLGFEEAYIIEIYSTTYNLISLLRFKAQIQSFTAFTHKFSLELEKAQNQIHLTKSESIKKLPLSVTKLSLVNNQNSKITLFLNLNCIKCL